MQAWRSSLPGCAPQNSGSEQQSWRARSRAHHAMARLPGVVISNPARIEFLRSTEVQKGFLKHRHAEKAGREPCSSATTATQSRHSRTNGNGLGDFG